MSQESVKRLQQIQNTCAKIIAGNKSATEAKKDLRLLPIQRMIDLEVCKLWHKKLLGILPIKLSEAMTKDHLNNSLIKQHRYETRQKKLINRPSERNIMTAS